jgi:hypothetical protein
MCGRARLPNDLEVTNRDCVSCNEMLEIGRLARRAVRTRIVQLLDVSLLPRFGPWHTLGERLGARVSFGRMHGSHSSWVPGNRLGRSGASPHQSSGVASPYRCSDWASSLMTITKTFVPYFNYPIVPL